LERYSLHPTQAVDARAAQKMHQHRFHLVISSMCHGYADCLALFC